MRIGVGAVRKPDEPAYRRFETYDVVDHGQWSVEDRRTTGSSSAHELGDANGYAYVYRKTLRVSGDTLVLEHRLENTGAQADRDQRLRPQLLHARRPDDRPDAVVQFSAFDPQGGAAAQRPGRDARARDPFPADVRVEGDGLHRGRRASVRRPATTISAIENRKTGAGVHVTGDRPLAKLLFWSAWKTVCPEPYIDMRIEPGKTFTWRITYEFYQAAKAAASGRRCALSSTETR